MADRYFRVAKRENAVYAHKNGVFKRIKSEVRPEKWLSQLTIHRVYGILFYDRHSRDDLAILSVSGPHYSENKRSNGKREEKGNRSMGKRLIILVCSMLIVLSGHAAVRAQQNAYIVVHAVNPEGVEIASIEGMSQNSVEIYDGNTLIGYGAYNAETHNQAIQISSGSHTIKVKFNGITMEQNINLSEGETQVLTFTFRRAGFDMQSMVSFSAETYSDIPIPIPPYNQAFHCFAPDFPMSASSFLDMIPSANHLVGMSVHGMASVSPSSSICTVIANASIEGPQEHGYYLSAGAQIPKKAINWIAHTDFTNWFVQDYPTPRTEFYLVDTVANISTIISPSPSVISANTHYNYIYLPAFVEGEIKSSNRNLNITETTTRPLYAENLKISSVPYDLTGTGVKDGEKQPPIASFTYSPERPMVGGNIIFDASASYDPDGTIVDYQWDFGDGNTASCQLVTHTYSEPGEYTVTLAVTDNDGLTNSTSTEIKVSEIRRIVRVDADHNIKIRDDNGRSITNPIWTIDEPETVKPIADVRGSDFVLNVKVRANPKPDWDPRVIGRFVFYRHTEGHEPESHQNVTGRVLDVDDPDGWIVELRPKAPTRVGKYTLDATFIVLGEDTKELDRKNIEIPFYIVFAKPNESLPLYPVKEPKTLWLDTACEWGRGASSLIDVPVSVMAREYSNPLNWVYHPNMDYWMGAWYGYIGDSGVGRHGHCKTWADVWVAMTRVLGVSGDYRIYTGDFITKEGLTSLAFTTEGYKTGNIVRRGSSERDRWWFGMHCVGFAGTFFDPTFGKIHAQLRDAVCCDYDGWWFDDYDFYRTYTNPMGCVCKLYDRKNPVQYTCSRACEATSVTVVDDRPLDRSAYKAADKVVNGSLDYGLDTNGDGLYDYLVAVVTIDANQPGSYQIFPELGLDANNMLFGDTLLGTHLRALPMCELSLSAGANTVNLYFSGRDIRASGVSGPYTGHAILYDEQRNYIDDGTFTTSAYSHIDFQPSPLQVASVSDYGEDTDGDSLFNCLTTELTLDVRQDANYGIEATLFSNETFVESISKYLPLEKGLQKVKFPFDGKKIRQKKSDGPYSVQLLVSDGDYPGYVEYETKFYESDQFQLLDSAFTDNYNDYGVDADNDGLYDYLVVEADVNTIVPGEYCIIGRLDNSDGNEISSTHYVGELEAGIHTISLEFGALAIFKHQINSPCVLDVCIYDQNGVEVDRRENAYTTASYDSTQFQKPTIEFTSRYVDYGVDEDDNGLYDYLIIETDVNVVEPGNYSGVAWLAGNGTVIAKMSGSGYLDDGVQTIDLEFDGASIYERGIQGPYTLLYLALYDENGDLVNYDWNIYETVAYKCTEFEGSGLRGDFNNDHSIDPNDFVWLCSHWLEQECQYPLWCDGTDIDRSGSINFVDYAILADYWLEGISP